MNLYLLRHGEAESRALNKPDSERALTEAGQQAIEEQAALYIKSGWPIERTLSSPYRRAQQTASYVASAFEGRVETDPLLASGASPEDVAELVRRYDAQHLFIVGHQPDMGRLVQYLCGGRVSFPVGGLAIIQTDLLRSGHGQLVGLYAPDVIASWRPHAG